MQGSLSYDSGQTTLTTPISCPEIPMAEHHLDHNSQEEVMFVSPFIPPNIASPPDPLNEAFLKGGMREEWSNVKGHFSEAVWINLPSTIILCSIRGISIEAQLIPNMEGNTMPWHLARTLLGNVSLKPSGKLFESCPQGQTLECWGVTSAVLVIIDEIEVNFDFHIFDSLDFDLLIGYPLENLYHASLGSLYENFGNLTLENPLAKPCPK